MTTAQRGSEQTRIRYIHHVSFRVDDLAASIDFYQRVLGCTPMDRPAISVPGAWLRAHDVQVHLIEWPREERLGAPPLLATPFANHVAFSVADFEGFRDHLIDEGLDPQYGPDPTVRQIVVQDPSGNVIEFTPYER